MIYDNGMYLKQWESSEKKKNGRLLCQPEMIIDE